MKLLRRDSQLTQRSSASELETDSSELQAIKPSLKLLNQHCLIISGFKQKGLTDKINHVLKSNLQRCNAITSVIISECEDRELNYLLRSIYKTLPNIVEITIKDSIIDRICTESGGLLPFFNLQFLTFARTTIRSLKIDAPKLDIIEFDSHSRFSLAEFEINSMIDFVTLCKIKRDIRENYLKSLKFIEAGIVKFICDGVLEHANCDQINISQHFIADSQDSFERQVGYILLGIDPSLEQNRSFYLQNNYKELRKNLIKSGQELSTQNSIDILLKINDIIESLIEKQIGNLIKALETLLATDDHRHKLQVQQLICTVFNVSSLESLKYPLIKIRSNPAGKDYPAIRKIIDDAGGIENLLTIISNKLSQDIQESDLNPLKIYKKHKIGQPIWKKGALLYKVQQELVWYNQQNSPIFFQSPAQYNRYKDLALEVITHILEDNPGIIAIRLSGFEFSLEELRKILIFVKRSPIVRKVSFDQLVEVFSEIPSEISDAISEIIRQDAHELEEVKLRTRRQNKNGQLGMVLDWPLPDKLRQKFESEMLLGLESVKTYFERELSEIKRLPTSFAEEMIKRLILASKIDCKLPELEKKQIIDYLFSISGSIRCYEICRVVSDGALVEYLKDKDKRIKIARKIAQEGRALEVIKSNFSKCYDSKISEVVIYYDQVKIVAETLLMDVNNLKFRRSIVLCNLYINNFLIFLKRDFYEGRKPLLADIQYEALSFVSSSLVVIERELTTKLPADLTSDQINYCKFFQQLLEMIAGLKASGSNQEVAIISYQRILNLYLKSAEVKALPNGVEVCEFLMHFKNEAKKLLSRKKVADVATCYGEIKIAAAILPVDITDMEFEMNIVLCNIYVNNCLEFLQRYPNEDKGLLLKKQQCDALDFISRFLTIIERELVEKLPRDLTSDQINYLGLFKELLEVISNLKDSVSSEELTIENYQRIKILCSKRIKMQLLDDPEINKFLADFEQIAETLLLPKWLDEVKAAQNGVEDCPKFYREKIMMPLSLLKDCEQIDKDILRKIEFRIRYLQDAIEVEDALKISTKIDIELLPQLEDSMHCLEKLKEYGRRAVTTLSITDQIRPPNPPPRARGASAANVLDTGHKLP